MTMMMMVSVSSEWQREDGSGKSIHTQVLLCMLVLFLDDTDADEINFFSLSPRNSLIM